MERLVNVMLRRYRWWILGVALFTACISAYLGWITQPVTRVPDPSTVISMNAGLYNWPAPASLVSNTFDVPADEIPHILAILSSAVRYEERPQPSWTALGELHLICRGNRELTVLLFRPSRGPGAFSIGGAHYRGGASDAM